MIDLRLTNWPLPELFISQFQRLITMQNKRNYAHHSRRTLAHCPRAHVAMYLKLHLLLAALRCFNCTHSDQPLSLRHSMSIGSGGMQEGNCYAELELVPTNRTPGGRQPNGRRIQICGGAAYRDVPGVACRMQCRTPLSPALSSGICQFRPFATLSGQIAKRCGHK